MTKIEFVERLSKIKAKWRINAYGEIRAFDCCPLTAESEIDASNYLETGAAYGLSTNDIIEITLASDAQKPFDPTLRAELLAACGLGSETA